MTKGKLRINNPATLEDFKQEWAIESVESEYVRFEDGDILIEEAKAERKEKASSGRTSYSKRKPSVSKSAGRRAAVKANTSLKGSKTKRTGIAKGAKSKPARRTRSKN